MRYNQLTEYERYQIYDLLKEDSTQKRIAQILNRSPSSISRELRRNKGLRGYRPIQAQRLSDQRRASAHKAHKLTASVCQSIDKLVRKELSPQQVAGYLKADHSISLHHETIYQLIYADKHLGGDLYKHLRIASKPYRKRYGHYDRRGKLIDRVDISERPSVVDELSRIGDWEGDTIMGKNKKRALLTMVERKTLYTVILQLSGKHAELLAKAAISGMKHLKECVQTITLDNGLEFAKHAKIAKGLEADIYLARPYASWQRGINENTNGLICQYFPKGRDFNVVSENEIKRVNPLLLRNYFSVSVIFSQYSYSLIPEILKTVNMVVLLCKQFTMINSLVIKITHIKRVI